MSKTGQLIVKLCISMDSCALPDSSSKLLATNVTWLLFMKLTLSLFYTSLKNSKVTTMIVVIKIHT